MTRFLRRLCRTCWGWRFYLVGLLGWSVIEAALFLTQDRWDFIHASAEVGTVGIGLTIAYTVIVLAVMIATRPKTTLDRRFIWHMASVMLLFLYAFILYVRPEWFGQRRPRDIQPIDEPATRLVIAAAIWFQIWGFIMWSALAVLLSTWNERGRFVWSGFTRRLRPLDRDAGEVSEPG